jgi:hypothetical protein
MRRTVRLAVIAILLAIGGTVLPACRGSSETGDRSNGGGSINVAIVDTPNTQELAHLTPSLFTAKSRTTKCTAQFSAVIAGKESMDSALRNCQNIASRVR